MQLVTDCQQGNGCPRQVSILAHPVKHRFKLRDEEDQHADQDQRANNYQERGIGHRAEHASFEFLLMLREVCDPLQRIFQKASLFTSPHHTDGQFWKNGGVLPQRFGQPGSISNLITHFLENQLERCMTGLPFQQFQ